MSVYQVDIDIWHFSSVGVMIMIMNVLWENLKSISNISWASLTGRRWLEMVCGGAKETGNGVPQHRDDMYQDMPSLGTYYKEKNFKDT